MCGIIGYIGKKQASGIIVKGLKYLEYRGYDSSGIAVYDRGEIKVVKKEGRIHSLENALKEHPLTGSLAIGHTRWATHGKPSDSNAHPFVSETKKFSVVHNGIIENYLEIKEELMASGRNFYSQTDSEAVAQLIEYLYKGDIKEAILGAVKRLKGTFALGIISVFKPDTIYAVRKDNPLIVGIGGGENYICSDIVSMQKFTGKVIVLGNCQMAEVTDNSVKLYGFDGEELPIKYTAVDIHDGNDAMNFENYMDKEIKEIPASLETAIMKYKEKEAFSGMDIDYFKGVRRIFILGCGTALHAGMVGKNILKALVSDIDVFCEVASEFRYSDFYVDDKTLTVCISQSGETADTLSCIRLIRERGGKVLSFCNVPTSSMAHESDYVILTNAGPEVAVASTKAYNCQNAMLALFALDLAFVKGKISIEEYNRFNTEMRKMPALAKECLKTGEKLSKLAVANYRRKSVFYLGRGMDYLVAMEGSLKLKEISYIHCEAYPAGELKHGTLALIEKGVLVVAVVTQTELLDKMYSSLCEVKSRGANIITVTPFTENKLINDVSDSIVPLPPHKGLFSAVVSVIPLQLFAYFVARAKGCDIDKPRNLAKSVTVE